MGHSILNSAFVYCHLFEAGVMSKMLPNIELFAALAFTATNADMSWMLGLLPDCWILSATIYFNKLSVKMKWYSLYYFFEGC